MTFDYSIIRKTPFTADIKLNMQKFSRTYFAERLKKLGFVSWRAEDLSWYKLVNQEVLLTIYLFNFSPYKVVYPALAYGMHGAFVRPAMPEKVTFTEFGHNTETQSIILFDTPQRPMAADIPVMQTDRPDGGYAKFEDVVWSTMGQIQTLDDAYQLFKEEYIRISEERNRKYPEYAGQSAVATINFMDEAIYMNDAEMIAYCANDFQIFLASRHHKKEHPRIQKQMDAVFNGNRDKYLRDLEKRRERILHTLQKEAGLRRD